MSSSSSGISLAWLVLGLYGCGCNGWVVAMCPGCCKCDILLRCCWCRDCVENSRGRILGAGGVTCGGGWKAEVSNDREGLPSSLSRPKLIGLLLPDLRAPANSSSGGAKLHTSITVRCPLFAITTAFSSSNTTLQTASAGWLSSRMRVPVLRSHTLTRPSEPPDIMRDSLNWRDVTLLSCAARRWIGERVSRDQTRTEPSEPPVQRME